MASTLPPVKGVAFNFPIGLVDQGDTDVLQTTVTITTADVWVSIDGAAMAAAAAAPTELLTTPGGAKTGVLWQNLTAAEMNGDVITVLYHDADGSEWQDAVVTIYTCAQTLDTIDGLIDTLLARLGAWTGTLRNTVLGAFQALFRKDADASVPSDINADLGGGAGAAVNTTDSVEAIRDNMGTAQTGDSYAVVTNATYGLDKLARTGADGDTLETLSDQLDTAQADLDNPAQYKADVSSLATAASVAALPTAAGISDAVWDEASAAHVAAGSMGAALAAAGGTGAGAIEWEYTLTSSVDGSPIADADIWVSTDAAGSNIIASGQTDAYGKVTFYLDAGTVYVWRQKSGWDFTNPDTETVA